MIQTVTVIAILVLIIGIAAFYIIKEKKKGAKCIGCPSSKTCSSCNCKSKKNR